MDLSVINTPAAIIDLERMRRNIHRMQNHMNRLGVAFRPHVKTGKCPRAAKEQLAAGAKGITVSTLKEAEQFFALGVTDIIYAVGIVPAKLPKALELMRRGCDLKIITDSLASAKALADFGRTNATGFSVLIEIDTDGHLSCAT